MNLKLTPEQYRAWLRSDFYSFFERCHYVLNPNTPFLENWHLEVMAAELDACRRGETTRLIINVPPRSLKSICATAFVAFGLGKDPSTEFICASYAQDLANKHGHDCRTIVMSDFYQSVFPETQLSPSRQSVQEFATTKQGCRLSTSVGGVLTGRGANFIIIDDPLKPEEALSDVRRNAANNWFDNTLYSRLNDKKTGCIILIMQRLHEDDLVGHVLRLEPWKVIRFPAIAEQDETHVIHTPFGIKRFTRRAGEALHPEREPLEILNRIRETLGEYAFAGQYQQAPAPFGGGLVKIDWFRRYLPEELPQFQFVFQSWDTANKPSELSDYCVCTTWGVKEKHLYLTDVYRQRMGYPELKRTVREQAAKFSPKTILVEDKASGTQLIQELVQEGMSAIKRYEPTMDKVMRLHSVTSTIENGFVHVPRNAPWLENFLHELATFPNGKHDDQADSVSQALDWVKQGVTHVYGVLEYYKQLEQETAAGKRPISSSPLVNRGALLREWDRRRF